MVVFRSQDEFYFIFLPSFKENHFFYISWHSSINSFPSFAHHKCEHCAFYQFCEKKAITQNVINYFLLNVNKFTWLQIEMNNVIIYRHKKTNHWRTIAHLWNDQWAHLISKFYFYTYITTRQPFFFTKKKYAEIGKKLNVRVCDILTNVKYTFQPKVFH